MVTAKCSHWFRECVGLAVRMFHQLVRNGFQHTAVRVTSRWRENRRERRCGIQTNASIDGRTLGHGSPDNLGYQPIPFESFDRALEEVHLTPGKDVFLDLGCGMGRAVVLAALLPFRRVIGVEISEELAAVARRNLNSVKTTLVAGEAEIISADATKFGIPDDVSVIFMFNPFCGGVLQAVLQRIHVSLTTCPRACSVIYAHPKENVNLLDSCSWLHRETELVIPSETWQQIVIYRARVDVETLTEACSCGTPSDLTNVPINSGVVSQ